MGLSFREKVESHLAAGYSLLFVRTYEELRARIILRRASASVKKKFYLWSVTVGLCQVEENDTLRKIDNTEPPERLIRYLFGDFCMDENDEDMKVVVLCDFHPYLVDPITTRIVREIGSRFKEKGHNLVFLSSLFKVPEELRKDLTLLELDLPDKEELEKIISDIGKDNEIEDLNEDSKSKVIEALSGLTTTEAENALALSIYSHNSFVPTELMQTKASTIRKSGVLEFYESQCTMMDVGGFPVLKEYLGLRGLAFSKGALEYGLDYPKGILILGIPGCGKSLVAKAISNLWGFPLLLLDMGKVFGSLVGESEERIREALALADAIAPCILFFDEIEKGLAGAGGSGQHDSGVAKRVFGTILTRMQERTSPVYYVATANDISALPAPLLRKGRFDEIYFVDLPNARERYEIFEIHLSKRKRNPKRFNLKVLVERTKDFTGSEIEEIVKSGLYYSFSDDERELQTSDLLLAIERTVPLSRTMSVELDSLRKWAKGRAVSVSEVDERKQLKRKRVRMVSRATK